MNVTDQAVFEELFSEARKSRDVRGAVAACVVDGEKIFAVAASADDGVQHAEDLLLEKLKEQAIPITSTMTLYTTKEPNVRRTFTDQHQDCTTLIIEAGIKQVVFGASNNQQHAEVARRFEQAGVGLTQVADQHLIEESERIFSETDTTQQ